MLNLLQQWERRNQFIEQIMTNGHDNIIQLVAE